MMVPSNNAMIFVQMCILSVTYGWFFSGDEVRCYRSPDIGCFPIDGHFTNSMGFKPKSPRDVRVRFIHKANEQTDRDRKFSLRQTERKLRNRFIPSQKTVVIIHGYIETPEKPWIGSMVNALHTEGPKNIFVVDWSRGAGYINFFQSVANARVAGAIIALFLQKLVDMGASTSNLHVIGFSLGAHVAGYAGARMAGIGRITGLDPAGPGFVGYHADVQLDPTDAHVVDVVHTDKELGTMLSMGDIDFYPNGGYNQPGCESGTISRISSFISQLELSGRSVTRTIGCSHIRAPQMFTASINGNCVYSMLKCETVSKLRRNEGEVCNEELETCPTFGYHLNYTPLPASELFRFDATATHPYC